MKATIYGKKRMTKDGKKSFYTYLTTLKRKNGEEVTCEVKFKEECGNPKNVPCVIEFEKKDANYSEKSDSYTDENGDIQPVVRKVLWVSKFKESAYVDTSLDDFE